MQIRFIGRLYQGDGLKFISGQHDIVEVEDEMAKRLLKDNQNDFKAIEPEPVELPFIGKMIADPDSVTVKQITEYALENYPDLVLVGKKADKIEQIVKASGGRQ